MTEKNDNLQNTRRRVTLHAALRVAVAILLQAGMFRFVNGMGETGLNNFLIAFLPTVSILVLIPVLIRGSLGERTIAVVLLLPAAWFGFMGWQNVIYRFMDFPFGH
ncbi:MAG: hypothetical protein ACREFE_00005 [Limisphaerales bacterium]